MCTAVTCQPGDLYLGRTLDYEHSFGEEVVILPRGVPFPLRHLPALHRHYAMLGMAAVTDGMPLYFDAVNEAGLGMVGLNFAGNAQYSACSAGRQNVAQFELIVFLLGQCTSVRQAIGLLGSSCITDTPFSESLPPAPLHWLLADRQQVVTVEAMADGLHILPNPVGVLTNNPPFAQQLFQLNNFMHLSAAQPENTFAPELSLQHYSRGMGALGLPGDLSSGSRFVRAAFMKRHSRFGQTEKDNVGQVFHILSTVEQPDGCCEVSPGCFEKTIYTACCNTRTGVYYYTTYHNHQISAVRLHGVDLDAKTLYRYPLCMDERIAFQN